MRFCAGTKMHGYCVYHKKQKIPTYLGQALIMLRITLQEVITYWKSGNVKSLKAPCFEPRPINMNSFRIIFFLLFSIIKYECMGVQPSGTPYMITKKIVNFHIVNPSHHIWVAKDSKLH